MEGAGKLIEDEELREAMREKGLGTPATRAPIIEGLIAEEYVHRKGRELFPTAKAFSLMSLLHGLGVPELISPELTGDWEFKLAQMEHGKLGRDEFMRDIVAMTQHIVGQAKGYESDTIPGDFGTLTCAVPEVRRRDARELQEVPVPGLRLRLLEDRRPAASSRLAEAEELLRERPIGPLHGFRSKMGRPFAASIKLNDDLTSRSSTSATATPTAMPRRPILSGQEPLGQCPEVRCPRVRARRRPTSAKRRSARRRAATSAPAA